MDRDGCVRAVSPPWPVADADSLHDFEIYADRRPLWALAAVGLAVTIICASLFFDFWGIGREAGIVGLLGILPFGFLTCRWLWMLRRRGPVIIMTDYGLRDLRIGKEFFLWTSIERVLAGERNGRKAVLLMPSPGLQLQLRWLDQNLWACMSADGDNIVLDPTGLTTDFETLLRRCRHFHEVATEAPQCNRMPPKSQSLAKSNS
jgi:hypothetical protein